MDEVKPVAVDEVGKSGGTPDTCKRADFFMWDLELLKDLEEGRQDGKVAAGRTPGGMIGK
jgi:hypothetical protein